MAHDDVIGLLLLHVLLNKKRWGNVLIEIDIEERKTHTLSLSLPSHATVDLMLIASVPAFREVFCQCLKLLRDLCGGNVRPCDNWCFHTNQRTHSNYGGNTYQLLLSLD